MIFSKVMNIGFGSYWALYKLGTTSNRVCIKFCMISFWYRKNLAWLLSSRCRREIYCPPQEQGPHRGPCIIPFSNTNFLDIVFCTPSWENVHQHSFFSRLTEGGQKHRGYLSHHLGIQITWLENLFATLLNLCNAFCVELGGLYT